MEAVLRSMRYEVRAARDKPLHFVASTITSVSKALGWGFCHFYRSVLVECLIVARRRTIAIVVRCSPRRGHD